MKIGEPKKKKNNNNKRFTSNQMHTGDGHRKREPQDELLVDDSGKCRRRKPQGHEDNKTEHRPFLVGLLLCEKKTKNKKTKKQKS